MKILIIRSRTSNSFQNLLSWKRHWLFLSTVPRINSTTQLYPGMYWTGSVWKERLFSQSHRLYSLYSVIIIEATFQLYGNWGSTFYLPQQNNREDFFYKPQNSLSCLRRPYRQLFCVKHIDNISLWPASVYFGNMSKFRSTPVFWQLRHRVN